MPIPQKILSRKDEITEDFFRIVDQHIDDLVNERVNYLFHARHFAERLFIHPRHLTNTLKLTTGRSPCDFMEERVLAEAQKLLRDTDLPVAATGARLGYSEATNFGKFYRSMTGQTPLQYRKAQQTAASEQITV